MNRMWMCLLLWPLFAYAAAPVIALDAQQELRYQALTQELRCLVCQNQNIADSHAPLAEDLREQVRSQLAAGKSDADIKRYMTDRYGEFVLYKPPFNAETLVLWGGPALLVLIGLVMAVLRMRRRENVPVVTTDAATVKKILDETT